MDVTETILGLYGSAENSQTRTRVRRDFCSFLRMNSIEPLDGLKLYVGTLVVDGMKMGTIHSYVGYLKRMFLSMIPKTDQSEFYELVNAISAAHADAETRSAFLPTIGQIDTLIMNAPTLEIYSVIAFMTLTGSRLHDMTWWQRQQIGLQDGVLTVYVKVAKNRKSPKTRRMLRVNTMEILGLSVPEEIANLISEGDPEERMFEGLTANYVNRQFKKICQDHEMPILTTYSLRKWYMARIAEHFNYDWTAMKPYSLHLDEKTTAAFYDGKE